MAGQPAEIPLAIVRPMLAKTRDNLAEGARAPKRARWTAAGGSSPERATEGPTREMEMALAEIVEVLAVGIASATAVFPPGEAREEAELLADPVE